MVLLKYPYSTPQPHRIIIRHEFDGGLQVLIMTREIIEYKIIKDHTSARALSHLNYSVIHCIDNTADRKETARFVHLAIEHRNVLYSGVTHNFDERSRATGQRHRSYGIR